MSAEALSKKRCVPCEGGIPALTEPQVKALLKDVFNWRLDGKTLVRDFEFTNFVKAMVFVNAVAEIAEGEGHHPDILIHQYRNVRITLWTHAVSGLTENDFILASKIDEKLS